MRAIRAAAAVAAPSPCRMPRPAVGTARTRGPALGAGVSDAAIRRSVRTGAWQVIAHGVVGVLSADVWASDDIDDYELGRRVHALRCAAAAVARPDHVVSARSAAILHGLP